MSHNIHRQELPKVVVYRKTHANGMQTMEQGYECMAQDCTNILEYRFDPEAHNYPWLCANHKENEQ